MALSQFLTQLYLAALRRFPPRYRDEYEEEQGKVLSAAVGEAAALGRDGFTAPGLARAA